ncbi:hypothetical protein ACG04R_05055 [Roseateles sp. BYS78W]|uniref:Uncharacterized protein n=1 Tax=Pelomonas candidula TaxID=3299025 RepID=A0ABW7H8G9_9BURK
MPARTPTRRLLDLATCAALGFCALPQHAGAADKPRPAAAASAASATGMPKRADNTPLHFDPPAAGPHGPTRADYEYCIEHPSPDGLYTDCSALLPNDPPNAKAVTKAAKPR